jgi:hypothetical protein
MMTLRSENGSLSHVVVIVCLALTFACDARKNELPRARAAQSDPPRTVQMDPPSRSSASAGVRSGAAIAQTQTTLLLALPVSAYQVSLVADDRGFYLLSDAAVHRLVPGKPPSRTPLELGYGATIARSGVVYWSKGAIVEAGLARFPLRKLARLPARPQAFVSSGNEFAWLERSEIGTFSLGALHGDKPQSVYTSTGSIDAVTMLSDWVFFVERAPDASWRIGGVKTAGGTPAYTAPRPGRSPSMLVGRRDLHYYDGNGLEVRRLSPDFQREEVLARDFICSPLAVWEHVYCAQVEGISELREGAPPRRLVTGTPGGPVTALAANASHLVWVSDAGADKLEVKALALEQPSNRQAPP